MLVEAEAYAVVRRPTIIPGVSTPTPAGEATVLLVERDVTAERRRQLANQAAGLTAPPPDVGHGGATPGVDGVVVGGMSAAGGSGFYAVDPTASLALPSTHVLRGNAGVGGAGAAASAVGGRGVAVAAAATGATPLEAAAAKYSPAHERAMFAALSAMHVLVDSTRHQLARCAAAADAAAAAATAAAAAATAAAEEMRRHSCGSGGGKPSPPPPVDITEMVASPPSRSGGGGGSAALALVPAAQRAEAAAVAAATAAGAASTMRARCDAAVSLYTRCMHAVVAEAAAVARFRCTFLPKRPAPDCRTVATAVEAAVEAAGARLAARHAGARPTPYGGGGGGADGSGVHLALDDDLRQSAVVDERWLVAVTDTALTLATLAVGAGPVAVRATRAAAPRKALVLSIEFDAGASGGAEGLRGAFIVDPLADTALFTLAPPTPPLAAKDVLTVRLLAPLLRQLVAAADGAARVDGSGAHAALVVEVPFASRTLPPAAGPTLIDSALMPALLMREPMEPLPASLGGGASGGGGAAPRGGAMPHMAGAAAAMSGPGAAGGAAAPGGVLAAATGVGGGEVAATGVTMPTVTAAAVAASASMPAAEVVHPAGARPADSADGSFAAGGGGMPEPTALNTSSGAGVSASAVVAAGAGTAAAGGGGSGGGGGDGLRMHVLFVDDEDVNRRLGGRMLQKLKCTFVMLEDGDQVATALRSTTRPFDVILMDILMVRSDGAQVCQELRDVGVNLAIVAMTGHTSVRDVQRFMNAGFDVVLPKPFDINGMRRALTEAVARRARTNAATLGLAMSPALAAPDAVATAWQPPTGGSGAPPT